MVPLVLWITALVDYRNVQATLYPYNNRLAHAEDTLKSAQEVYVDMRQEMLETKATLEETVDNHKEAVKKAKAIEGELKVSCMHVLVHVHVWFRRKSNYSNFAGFEVPIVLVHVNAVHQGKGFYGFMNLVMQF